MREKKRPNLSAKHECQSLQIPYLSQNKFVVSPFTTNEEIEIGSALLPFNWNPIVSSGFQLDGVICRCNIPCSDKFSLRLSAICPAIIPGLD